MPSSRRVSLAIASIAVAAAALLVTPGVTGSRQDGNSASNGVATIDLLTLLEDYLQTETYKPARDAYRAEWEERLGALQSQLQRIETELRMSSPQDPGVGALQQQYQQTGFEFQQVQREATVGFDRFNADQAAEAYSTLYAEAKTLADAAGYSHLVVSRRAGEITERGNLATVTQEILARPLILSPDADDLTESVREQLSIPVPPEPEDTAAGDAGVEAAPAEAESE